MAAFFKRWIAHFRIKQMQLELWRGRKFQKYCQKIECHNLADLERSHNIALEQRIHQMTAEIAQDASRK